jgi:hypothetical protein
MLPLQSHKENPHKAFPCLTCHQCPPEAGSTRLATRAGLYQERAKMPQAVAIRAAIPGLQMMLATDWGNAPEVEAPAWLERRSARRAGTPPLEAGAGLELPPPLMAPAGTGIRGQHFGGLLFNSSSCKLLIASLKVVATHCCTC